MNASHKAYDVVVVGAGMAGSIIAGKCAEAGLSTLVLDTGGTNFDASPKTGGLAAKIKRKLVGSEGGKAGRWPHDMLFRSAPDANYRTAKGFLGIGPGGSARIYGAALGRARPDDFSRSWDPQAWDTSASPCMPNNWPIAMSDLLPRYQALEETLAIAGTPDPLDPEDNQNLRVPPSLSPGHERIWETLRTNGRHPYRLHVGISYRPGCWECQGTSCPRNCKSHSYNRILEPMLHDDVPVQLLTEMTVRSLERSESGALFVKAVAKDGAERSFAADKVILAAGALNTPRILQASSSLWDGEVPSLIGAGLMFHSSEIFAVSGLEKNSLYGPRKVLAFRDHYRDGDMPLAECQSLGMLPDPVIITKHIQRLALEMGIPLHDALLLLLRMPASIVARRFSNSELFTAALEDLPYAHNRVDTVIQADGIERIAITYRIPDEMRMRSQRFRELAKEAFAPLKLDFFSRPGSPNLGHPMGTCRMGDDPDHSVIDPDCKVWEQEGIYVADASVFPSSLGINPGLTVAANALRIAERLFSISATSEAPSVQAH